MLCINILYDSPTRFEVEVSDRTGEILHRWCATAGTPWLMAMHRVAILDVAIPNLAGQLSIDEKGIRITSSIQ